MGREDSPATSPPRRATWTTERLDAICRQRASEAARRWGDVSVATRRWEDNQGVVVVAAFHRDLQHQAVAERVIGDRYRRGQSLPGRVFDREVGILIVEVDVEAISFTAPETARSYVKEVGLASMMIVPLRVDGVVVGTLGVARNKGGRGYSEEQFADLSAFATVRLEGSTDEG